MPRSWRAAPATGRSPWRCGSSPRGLPVAGWPLIGPVEGAAGASLDPGPASWGILNAPATGRMISEMILDGRSTSLDAEAFALTRLPSGRIAG